MNIFSLVGNFWSEVFNFLSGWVGALLGIYLAILSQKIADELGKNKKQIRGLTYLVKTKESPPLARVINFSYRVVLGFFASLFLLTVILVILSIISAFIGYLINIFNC